MHPCHRPRSKLAPPPPTHHTHRLDQLCPPPSSSPAPAPARFEILTLMQLRKLGSKFPVPLILANLDGVYDGLLDFLKACDVNSTLAAGEVGGWVGGGSWRWRRGGGVHVCVEMLCLFGGPRHRLVAAA